PMLSEEEVEDRMVTRLCRHSVLMRHDPPKLLAIIDELALHRFVGGREVLRRQLEHLAQESRRPNITVHIVPNDGHAHPGVEGSFLVLHRTGFSPVVYADTLK
ncbi:MAG: transcriptional regulator, partial [Mycobacterium sp.]|nr:transcriptional regulator [Mycobacterium sp.]